jgi:glycosyltransferase involved in cell wall biosynthesis
MIQARKPKGAAVTDLISVIVATYRREDALDAVLRALARQTDRRFEVLVADDGSGPSTAELVESWKPKLGVPLSHVWHEDTGFRLAEIRNRAILRSRGVYCIFLDGDCIARPRFVAAHRRLAEPGWFVTGNRVLMSEVLSEFAMQAGRDPERWNTTTWIGLRSHRAVNRVLPLLSLPLGPLRKLEAKNWEGARGANIAVWRADLDRVDGFDASFNGWGREDSDLFVRLMRAGVRRKDGRYATAVLHLWHPEADRSRFAENHERLVDTLRSDRVRATIGLSALPTGEMIGGVAAAAAEAPLDVWRRD